MANILAAVAFARERGLDVAVRGGGHGGAGLALVDDGLVIDLATMSGVRVDPGRAQPRRWSQGRGSATPTAHLTLGGSHGYLSLGGTG